MLPRRTAHTNSPHDECTARATTLTLILHGDIPTHDRHMRWLTLLAPNTQLCNSRYPARHATNVSVCPHTHTRPFRHARSGPTPLAVSKNDATKVRCHGRQQVSFTHTPTPRCAPARIRQQLTLLLLRHNYLSRYTPATDSSRINSDHCFGLPRCNPVPHPNTHAAYLHRMSNWRVPVFLNRAPCSARDHRHTCPQVPTPCHPSTGRRARQYPRYK